MTPGTGTLAVRGILAQSERRAAARLFRARARAGTRQERLLVPDVAIGSDQGGRYLLVLNADNVVEQRKIEAGQHVGPLRVIERG